MAWIVNKGDGSNLPLRGELIDVVYRDGAGAICVPALTPMEEGLWTAEHFNMDDDDDDEDACPHDILRWRPTKGRQYAKAKRGELCE